MGGKRGQPDEVCFAAVKRLATVADLNPPPTLGVTELRLDRSRSDPRLETSRIGHGLRVYRSPCRRSALVASRRFELSIRTFSNPSSTRWSPSTRNSLACLLPAAAGGPPVRVELSCQQQLLTDELPCSQPGLEAIVRNAAVNALAATQQVREPARASCSTMYILASFLLQGKSPQTLDCPSRKRSECMAPDQRTPSMVEASTVRIPTLLGQTALMDHHGKVLSAEAAQAVRLLPSLTASSAQRSLAYRTLMPTPACCHARSTSRTYSGTCRRPRWVRKATHPDESVALSLPLAVNEVMNTIWPGATPASPALCVRWHHLRPCGHTAGCRT